MSMSKGEEMGLPLSAQSSFTSATRSPNSTQHKPNVIRKEIAVFIGEFIGTFMFFFLGFTGAQVALKSASMNPFVTTGENPPELAKLLYIAFAFSTALAVNASIFADISGGMFNPAVTTALCIVGLIRWPRALHSIFAQLLASISAAGVVDALIPGPLTVNTQLDPSFSLPRGLFLETFLTAQLILTILMLPAGPSKPMYIGGALFVAHLCGIYFTGASLNPARSFGPAVVIGFDSSQWIYWLGPMMGAGIAAGVFELVGFVREKE